MLNGSACHSNFNQDNVGKTVFNRKNKLFLSSELTLTQDHRTNKAQKSIYTIAAQKYFSL